MINRTPKQFAINPGCSCMVSGLSGGVYKNCIDRFQSRDPLSIGRHIGAHQM